MILRKYVSVSIDSSAAYMRQWIGTVLVQIMACRLFDTKPLSKPVLVYCPLGTNLSEIFIKIQNFSSTKMHLKLSSAKWQPFCPGELITFTILNENRDRKEWKVWISATPVESCNILQVEELDLSCSISIIFLIKYFLKNLLLSSAS